MLACVSWTMIDLESDDGDTIIILAEQETEFVEETLQTEIKTFESDLRYHMVMEMEDVDNLDLVELVAPNFTEIILTHNMIGRLIILFVLAGDGICC